MRGPLARLFANVAPLWRRLRAAKTPPTAVKPREIVGIALLGLVVAFAVGIADDARAFAWSTTLSDTSMAIFGWITRYGKSDWLLIPLGVVALVVAFCDWRTVPRETAAAWREIGLLAAAAFVVIALPGLLTDLIKPLVGRFRPGYVPYDAFAGAFSFAPFSFGGYQQYSFPSGHSTTMGAVAVLALMLLGRWSVPIVIAAGVVAASRVAVGAHFPSDVVGGLVVGAGTAYLIIRGLAVAGFGFIERPNHAIVPRVFALRTVVRRSGLGHLATALGTALAGRRD